MGTYLEATPVEFTVAIPTFERNGILRETIAAILPQLNRRWRLLILDNCGSQPVTSCLGDLLDGYTACEIQIVRHPVNIGGNANVLRCVEMSEGKWLWLLCDDDMPSATAVSQIEEMAAQHQDVAVMHFHYSSPEFGCRIDDVVYESLADYLVAGLSISPLIFASTQVFQLKQLKLGLRYGYQYAMSCAPLLAILLMVCPRGTFLRTQQSILVKDGLARADGGHYSPIPLFLGIGLLCDLRLDKELRSALEQSLKRVTRFWRFRTLLRETITADWVTRDPDRAPYLISECLARLYSKTWVGWILPRSIAFWRLIVGIRPVLIWVFGWYDRLKGIGKRKAIDESVRL